VYCQDPGYPLLKKLIGEGLAKVAFSESRQEYWFPPFLWRSSEVFLLPSHLQDLVREFLFEGVSSLGSKSFLDYFPDYARDDGTVNRKRSMMGKSFETRPWDANGNFIADAEEE
jgi:phytochromobilin:ferredoxin oxidoreductase